MKQKNGHLPLRLCAFVCTLILAVSSLGVAAPAAWATVYKADGGKAATVKAADIKKGDLLEEGATLQNAGEGTVQLSIKPKNCKNKDSKVVATDASTIEIAKGSSISVGKQGEIKVDDTTVYTPCYEASDSTEDEPKYTDGTAWKVAEVSDAKTSPYVIKLECAKPNTVYIDSKIDNGSVTPDVSSALEGDTVTVSNKPDTGYVLDTITVKDKSNKDVAVTDNTFTMPASDVTVSATFAKAYSVTVTADPASAATAKAEPATAKEGDTVKLSYESKDSTYGFKEWKVTEGGVSVKDNAFTMGSADVKVTAVFEKISGDINWGQGADEGAPQTTFKNFDDEFRAAILTDDDNAKLADGEDIKVTLDVTALSSDDVSESEKSAFTKALAAKDATAGAYFDISLYKEYGDGTEEFITDTRNNPLDFSVEVPENLQATGRTYYLFRYHDGEVTELASTTSTTIDASSNLFSTYLVAYSDADEPAATTKTVTVTFNANGGTGTMDPQSIVVNASDYKPVQATKLNANKFTRSGYTFAGWNTQADGKGKSLADKSSISKLSGNITLYAQWKSSKTANTGSKEATPKTGDASLVGMLPMALAGLATVGVGFARRKR